MEDSNPQLIKLDYKINSKRNLFDNVLTLIAFSFTLVTLLPLIFVLTFVILKGASHLDFSSLINLPEPPGDDLPTAGGMGNSILGTLIITSIAAFISIPIGIGGGIYLAEYSQQGNFAKFIRFGTNVLSGVPSIIAGVFVYGVVVSTKFIFGSTFTAIAGGIALAILMLPMIVKTTDEGLKLVSDDLRRASLGLGASKLVTITRITLPSAFTNIITGIILSIARAAGETAPLIFTALFSFYWPSGQKVFFEPIASLSVLIYNFALEPYEAQNNLAWAASLVLVIGLLSLNILAKSLNRSTIDK